MQNILAGHTNSYHTYTLDEALEGIAKAGFKYVELSAVRGWTEHVPLRRHDAHRGDQGQTGALGPDRLLIERPLGSDDPEAGLVTARRPWICAHNSASPS